MNTETACLGCGDPFDWDEGVCPECGWDRDDGRSGGAGGLGGLGPIR